MENKVGLIDISIVIVNYKSWGHLHDCLKSLDFSSDAFSFEVIVVDNQSCDGKLIDFQQTFSWVQFVENTGNNGFANGCNFGAEKAKGKFILFLNPDTIANEIAIQTMWEFAKQNPTVGIVSCKQKRPNGSEEKMDRLFPTLFTLFGFTRAIHKLFFKSTTTYEDGVLYTDWVSGSVVFMSKEWLGQLQGWNEDYWMYYEDMDLSKRVHLANGKVAVLPQCNIVHNHGGSSRINVKTASITKTEVQISKHVFIHTHFKGIEKYLSLLILVFYSILAKSILAFVGVLLFFIPKMRLQVFLWTKLMAYYWHCLIKGTWLSRNSMNYQ